VWTGVGLGLVASVGAAVVLQTTLRALPASREVIEGVTMLIAVAVLFSVSYWILSKVEADKWQRYIRNQVNSAVAGAGRAALVGVAFLVVFREGAETILFYQALLHASAVGSSPVMWGIVAGSGALAVVYLAFHKLGVRIPLRPFFAVTGSLLYLMAFVFAGKGMRELQEGGALSATPLNGIPMIDVLGVYPSVETIAVQWILAGLFLLACWRTFVTPRLSAAGARKSRGVPVPLSSAPPSKLPQPAQTRER
jgi:high-affinity iron transporter